MYPSWNISAISRGTLATTLHVIQPNSSVILFCTDSFPARGFKNIVSGLKARWEELLSKETAVDKEGLIAHQEGFIHPLKIFPEPDTNFFLHRKAIGKHMYGMSSTPPRVDTYGGE